MEKQKPNEVRKEKLSGGMKKEKEVRELQGPDAGVSRVHLMELPQTSLDPHESFKSLHKVYSIRGEQTTSRG